MQGKIRDADVLYMDIENSGTREENDPSEDQNLLQGRKAISESLGTVKEICQKIVKAYDKAGLVQSKDLR